MVERIGVGIEIPGQVVAVGAVGRNAAAGDAEHREQLLLGQSAGVARHGHAVHGRRHRIRGIDIPHRQRVAGRQGRIGLGQRSGLAVAGNHRNHRRVIGAADGQGQRGAGRNRALQIAQRVDKLVLRRSILGQRIGGRQCVIQHIAVGPVRLDEQRAIGASHCSFARQGARGGPVEHEIGQRAALGNCLLDRQHLAQRRVGQLIAVEIGPFAGGDQIAAERHPAVFGKRGTADIVKGFRRRIDHVFQRIGGGRRAAAQKADTLDVRCLDGVDNNAINQALDGEVVNRRRRIGVVVRIGREAPVSPGAAQLQLVRAAAAVNHVDANTVEAEPDGIAARQHVERIAGQLAGAGGSAIHGNVGRSGSSESTHVSDSMLQEGFS